MKIRSILFVLLASGQFSVQAQDLDKAREYIYYERFAAAEQELENVIKHGPKTPDAWYLLAKMHLENGKIASADSVVEAGLLFAEENKLTRKQSPLIHIGKAQILLESGKQAEARSLMEEILSESKNRNPLVNLAIADANLDSKLGDINWAIEVLEKGLKKGRSNPEYLTTLGDAYRKMIDGSNAIRYYNMALASSPNYAEALYKIGMIYRTQENVEVYLKYFNDAYSVDSSYAPVIFQLYQYYFGRNNDLAKKMLSAYIRNSDQSDEFDYMIADLHYMSKEYPDAIRISQNILSRDNQDVKPRLFKLLAYSNAELKDSASGLKYMKQYFSSQDTSEVIAKDYEFMANLLVSQSSDTALVIEWLTKAVETGTKDEEKIELMVQLADLEQKSGNRLAEALWRKRIYETKTKPSNIDLYKWGIALYSGEDYSGADSVFSIYEEKYPDQIYGYLWRARSNALIDTTMELGLAIPHYKNLINVALKDSVANKANLFRAYGYLGAYEANVSKDYPAALEYFNKVLELEPENSDAIRYKEILEGWISESATNSAGDRGVRQN